MATECSACSANGNVFNCQCFNSTKLTAGADTIARLYALEGNGQLDASTANGIISNVVSYGYTIATLTCQQAFVNAQTLEIDCNDPVIGDLVKNNPNCVKCKALAAQVAADRQKLEDDAAQINPNYQKQQVDPDIAESYFGVLQDHSDGICKYVCFQCIVENLSQNIQMQLVADCDINTKTFISAFTSGMSVQAEVELTQHQQALRSTGLDIQNQDDIKSLSIEMANTIRDMTTVKMLNALKQYALNVQNMKISPDSTSVMVQNATQGITTSMFASIVSKTYSNTSIQNSIDYQQKAQTIQIETSFTDLINSLQTTVQTIESLLIQTVGRILITLLALLLVVLFAFSALMFFRPSFLFGSTLDNQDGDETSKPDDE